MNKLSNKTSFIKKCILKNYGLSEKTCSSFSKFVGTNRRINSNALKRKQISYLSRGVNKITRHKMLKENIRSNILFLMENKTYKGIRHKSGQPVRGQRTHTNAKTKKKIF
jgi:ribosomal protein S13